MNDFLCYIYPYMDTDERHNEERFEDFLDGETDELEDEDLAEEEESEDAEGETF